MLLVFFFSGGLAYLAGVGLKKRPRLGRLFLAACVLGNVGLLVAVRYLPFITSTIGSILDFVGLETHAFDLPPTAFTSSLLGVSFYTLQSIGYAIDVYRKRTEAVLDPLHLLAYLSFFPKLMAGPIVRSREFLPKLKEMNDPDEETRWAGLKLMVYGYFRKMVIADTLAPLVDRAFSGVRHVTPGYWWVVVAAFAFQLYFDFSGYSSIARGLSTWMGYELPVNFNYPYFARSIGDFWNRWHISLTFWLREYIFFPLNRARRGRLNAHLNMWLTMLVSGLWHGADWTFVVWGGLHAVFISIERATQWPRRLEKIRIGKWIAMILVLAQVWIAWVFFRAESLARAVQVLGYMFDFSAGWGPLAGLNRAVFILIGMLFELYLYFKLDSFDRISRPARHALGVASLALLIFCCVYLRGPGTQFIYNQF
ncbi:MAG: MBOAT family O-acyltransferase [Anaerolineales bacterium]